MKSLHYRSISGVFLINNSPHRRLNATFELRVKVKWKHLASFPTRFSHNQIIRILFQISDRVYAQPQNPESTGLRGENYYLADHFVHRGWWSIASSHLRWWSNPAVTSSVT